PHRFQFFSCEGRHRLPLLSELNGGIVRLPLRELYNAHGLPLTANRCKTIDRVSRNSPPEIDRHQNVHTPLLTLAPYRLTRCSHRD
ncbi:hypothetical protein, partial [Paraburkholderia sp. NMBU_R16]|uniref:hypothetical protein n=1 Tax=Paraburkholderia sp. NMBU_R16 TaxID=2698676 RepID=UPI001C26B8BD